MATARAAKQVGVHLTALSSWLREYKADPEHAFRDQGKLKPEQVEIEELRRELARMTTERDILRKAMAYFA